MSKSEKFKRGFAEYDGEGVTVRIVPNGLPAVASILPGPAKSETDREQMIEAVSRAAWSNGLWVESVVRVRNPVFDKRDEKGSVKMKFRPCKTEVESKFVLLKIMEILGIGRASAGFIAGDARDDEQTKGDSEAAPLQRAVL